MDPYQIRGLDYQSLVSLLIKNISPYTRKIVLEELMRINDNLIRNHNSKMQVDLARKSVMETKKNSVIELPHPSSNFNYRNDDLPIPLSRNMSSSITDDLLDLQSLEQSTIYTQDKINLGNIFTNAKQENQLDIKLKRINNLYKKIINDRHKKRQQRRANVQ